jgi:hypothetical protein
MTDECHLYKKRIYTISSHLKKEKSLQVERLLEIKAPVQSGTSNSNIPIRTVRRFLGTKVTSG